MRNPDELTKKQLVEMVRDIQAILYLEDGVVNPDKSWDCEATQHVAEALARYDLAPTEDDDITHCEICGERCSHQAGEDEVCQFCGLVICQEHVDYAYMSRIDIEEPVCVQCATLRGDLGGQNR